MKSFSLTLGIDSHFDISYYENNDFIVLHVNTRSLIKNVDKNTLGRRQVVSHRFLVSAFAGSNPAVPVIFYRKIGRTCNGAENLKRIATNEIQ